MRYTMTPVMVTYNQMGNVHRAIFLCNGNSDLHALSNVNNAKGTMIAAKLICEIRIVKYTMRMNPSPPKEVEGACE